MTDWAQQIAANNPSIDMSELQNAMSFHTRSPGIAKALGSSEAMIAANEAIAQTGGAGGEGMDSPGSGSYPEAFRCIYDPDSKSFKIQNPIVCTASGVIKATGSSGLSAGSYYCKVERTKTSITASITTSDSTGNDTLVVVPICDITATDGIHQKHIGAINVPGKYHKLTVKKSDGSSAEYYVIADKDIEIQENDSSDTGTYLTDVELSLSQNNMGLPILNLKKTFSDGNTKDQVINLKKIVVVTSGNYIDGAFYNLESELTVFDEQSTGVNAEVFHTLPHSED